MTAGSAPRAPSLPHVANSATAWVRMRTSVLFRSGPTLRMMSRLLDAHARGLDDLGPFGALAAGKFSERIWRHRRRLAAHICKRRHRLGIAENALHLGRDLLDDRARRAGRRVKALPAGRLEPLHALADG